MIKAARGESVILNGKVPIVFRDVVPEIPSTTYGTFSVYKYPAKFIPQVVAYAIKEYAKPGMRVFDPFAGHGTTGIVARIYGYDYELWDLNPLMELIHDTAMMEMPSITPAELVAEIKESNCEFIPRWSNLYYWFPQEFIPMLSGAWGFVHSLSDERKYAFLLPLLKATKYFSYCDDKGHKLYKSKWAIRKVNELLNSDWKSAFFDMLEKEIDRLFTKIRDYDKLSPKRVNYKIRAGVDVVKTKLDNDVGILITSPPYMQAQEYIRSTKMDLFWLGYSEEYIRELSRKEIPYNSVNSIDIYSDKYHEIRRDIRDNRLISLYDAYFNSILGAFSSLSDKVSDYMCILVGAAKVRTIPVPIDEIIVEHMSQLGWRHVITLADKIVSRVMFKSSINPASGMADERIGFEYLVVLKR